VDIRAERLGRRARINLGIVGDVRETLKELEPLLQGKANREFLDAILEKHRRKMEDTQIYVWHVAENRLIHPEYVAAKIDEIADADAVIACDTGMCNVWMARHIKATLDRRLLASYSHGSMTNAVPYAVDAQFLYLARQVISMSGDGGLAMLLGELLTVMQYDLPVKIVVFNNSSLAFVNLETEVAGYEGFETELKNPNFADVAKAIGIYGIRIENPGDVEPGLREAFAHKGAAVIDVVTDPNVLSLPPKISPAQVEGYAVTMGELILSGEIEEIAKKVRSNIRHVKEIL
jgi:pyruvate dehydrogenase (quinone)